MAHELAAPLGLTGATQATRYAGATTSGAPASGTFAIGDYVIARDGKVWVCTTAGSPGTWTDVGGGGGAPAAHKTTHSSGGTDVLLPSDLRTQFSRWLPTGAKVETFPRNVGPGVTGTAVVSGTLQLTALSEPLRAGVVYTSISFVNGGTALALGTSPHLWMTLINLADMKTLRTTTDDTAATWGANSVLTKNLSSTYTPAADTDVYVGLVVAQTGGTLPTVLRATVDAVMAGLAPITCGTSNTGATTAPADATTMTSITATARALYAYVS